MKLISMCRTIVQFTQEHPPSNRSSTPPRPPLFDFHPLLEPNKASDELLIATTFLHKMARVPDVRTPLIKAFDLHQQVHGVRSSSLTPAHLTRLHNNNSSSSGRTRLYHDVASLSTTSTTTDDDTDSRSSSIVSTVSTASSTTTYTSATSQGIESCASFSSCSSWGSEVVGRSGNAPRGWASMLFKKGVPMVDRAARGAVSQSFARLREIMLHAQMYIFGSPPNPWSYHATYVNSSGRFCW